MRRFWLIGLFLFAAVLAACSSSVGKSGERPCRELEEIDSLMWKRADSAFVMLLDFVGSPKYDSLDDFNGHYCQLLVSELLYKNYYEQSNRQELLQALEYLDSLGDAYLDARAHYMNGVGFYEQGDIEEACKEYLVALETMEDSFPKGGFVGNKAQFMACIYNRLGDLFAGQLLCGPAITCFKQSKSFCEIESTTVYGVPIILYNIGIQHYVSGQVDSAFYYYEKALETMPDTNNVHFRDVITTRAMLSYELGQSLDSVLKIIEPMASMEFDEEERLTRYLTLGCLLYDNKRYDSSRVFLEAVFESQKDIQSKIIAAENLRNIYSMSGDSIKAQKTALFLANYTLKEIEKNAEVSKINTLFQEYMTKRQAKKADKETDMTIRKVLRVVLGVIVVAILVAVLSVRFKDKDTKQRHKKAMEIEREKHRVQQAALSGRLKRSNEELRQMKKLMSYQDGKAATIEKAKSFEEEPMYRLIMERVNNGQFKSKIDCSIYKDYALKKQQLLALRMVIDQHFGQFTSRLKKEYPQLTNSDLDYCCLYLLGLNDADVAALMQRAYNTVTERNGKLRRILGDDNPLVITLTGIANNTSSD